MLLIRGIIGGRGPARGSVSKAERGAAGLTQERSHTSPKLGIMKSGRKTQKRGKEGFYASDSTGRTVGAVCQFVPVDSAIRGEVSAVGCRGSRSINLLTKLHGNHRHNTPLDRVSRRRSRVAKIKTVVLKSTFFGKRNR